MRTRNERHARTMGAGAGLLLATALLLAPAGARAEKSLYDRLGGVGPISMVVDEFIDRLAVDPVLNANKAIKESRARAPRSYLKFHVTTLVCQVTGGPCKYTGRDMKTAHAHLAITEKEWAQMAKVFKQVLDKYKVPEKEQQELFTIVGGTKTDIVVAAAPAKLDTRKIAEHLRKDVTYPATKGDLVAACNHLADFSPEEKKWFGDKLPDGRYASAAEVMKAVGLRP